MTKEQFLKGFNRLKELLTSEYIVLMPTSMAGLQVITQCDYTWDDPDNGTRLFLADSNGVWDELFVDENIFSGILIFDKQTAIPFELPEDERQDI